MLNIHESLQIEIDLMAYPISHSSTCIPEKISRLSLSRIRNRVSRSEHLDSVCSMKILHQVTKYCWKEENENWLGSNVSSFSSCPQYFQYFSNYRSLPLYSLMKCGCSIYFSWNLHILYFEVRISRRILDSPLDFEITGIDCSLSDYIRGGLKRVKIIKVYFGHGSAQLFHLKVQYLKLQFRAQLFETSLAKRAR